MIVNTPGTGAESNLEQRVTVQQDDDGDQDTKRERMMGQRLVRFVEGVRPRHFVLVVYKFLLLKAVEDGELVLFVFRGVAKLDIHFNFASGRKVVLIL